MDKHIKQTEISSGLSGDTIPSFDYTFVQTIARIALYDDLRSAPRIIEIQPAPTVEFIESLASLIYEQAKLAGGKIPYTAIREVSENFIHACFKEIIVSILDGGDTIRFADQGPGISEKEKATLPGFTSAIEPMKHYIRGVGSGLPIVKEYLDFSQGSLTIEDNLGTGAVVTLSLHQNTQPVETPISYRTQQTNTKKGMNSVPFPIPPLTQRERQFLSFLLNEGALGVTDMTHLTQTPPSSTYAAFQKLEQAGLVEKTSGQKRILTDMGFYIANSL